MPTETKPRLKRLPQLSGWCSKWSPMESHARCAGGNAANPDKEWQACPCKCHGDGVPVPAGTQVGGSPVIDFDAELEAIETDEPEDEDEYECGECGEQVIEREDGAWVHYFTDEEECG